ncbi:MAG: hypothetical protein JOY71_14715 [Acetobacteraceae bacterium]|nr:hypothetical protein [Acetobacteraceae bacterium]MBV8523352.1 hypothetical protein [Acetobacteraceae bacterium]
MLRKLRETESGTARLEEAVAAERVALEVRTRELLPLERAESEDNLGFALWQLGKRESSTKRLEQAVAAFHAALEVITQEVAPFDWAMAEDNLGNALTDLGSGRIIRPGWRKLFLLSVRD